MNRLLHTSQPWHVRLIAATMLVAFAVASIGYPMWSGGEGKDLSRAFPCMHRKCGCRNAEQCWRSCCCFTNRDKLAWAKKNRVHAPLYVALAATKESPQVARNLSCCSSKAKTSCKTATSAASPVTTGASSTLSLVAHFEALRCQGSVEQWVAVGAIDVATVNVWQLELPLVGRIFSRHERCSSLTFAPASPPPWC